MPLYLPGRLPPALIESRIDTSTPSGRLLRNIMLTFAQSALLPYFNKGLRRGKKNYFSPKFPSAIFARQNDIKNGIILPGVEEPSLNISIHLIKLADSANVLKEALIETP